jgi:hypothetical protein
MKYAIMLIATVLYGVNIVNAEIIYDESRNRNIPIQISFPSDKSKCLKLSPCPVVFLSAGYGNTHTEYSFISLQLNELGYLVVAVGHELPSDPALSLSGDLFETRSENWRRGAKTLDYLQKYLANRFTEYDFENLILVGHSNGGDISAWLGNEGKPYIKTIITLDHRRVPLPRRHDIKILSIRASDFPADDGVLMTKTDLDKYDACIVEIPEARHNDIADFGPDWLKEKINLLIKSHLG